MGLTWDEHVKQGLNNIINEYGEIRNTSKNSIVFPNDWVASIVPIYPIKEKSEYKWLVAICDYQGYFDWEKLVPYGTKDGVIFCKNDEDVGKALDLIKSFN